jgi:hypothetical protein
MGTKPKTDNIPEIEVTLAMIEAGSEEIWAAGFGGAGNDSAAGLCERVLVASLRAGGFSVKTDAGQ